MNALKGLAVLAFLVAMFFGFRGVANAEPDTIDQPDLNGIVCQQLTLGETPGEIADQIRQGDARIAWPNLRVWDAVQDCG